MPSSHSAASKSGPSAAFPTFATADPAAATTAAQRSLQATAEMQAHALTRIARMNQEIVAFLERRAGRNETVAREFADCGDPMEACSVLVGFWQTAMRDYADHANTLARAAAGQASEAMEDVKQEIRFVGEPAAFHGARASTAGAEAKTRGAHAAEGPSPA